jgi:hypothetical protein
MSMRVRVSRRLSTAATVVALLAIPTIAIAHGGNNEQNVVHACIGNLSKVVRIVGASGTCISSPPVVAETPAHWAIQGLPGAPGINGTNGTNGAPGVNGTNGTNGTDGTSGANGTSVSFVDYFSGSQGGCPNGGAVYAAGNPAVNAYVCNGINGTNGTNGTDGTGGTRADGPCFDNANRYVDCGNGTVTDTVTRLIWLKDSACLQPVDWAAANGAAAGMKDGDCGGNLTDNSSPGDWRLPTKDEWSATIAQAAALGCTDSDAPSLTNDRGRACIKGGPTSFMNVRPWITWSNTPLEESPSEAYAAYLTEGVVARDQKITPRVVWPVRGGAR